MIIPVACTVNTDCLPSEQCLEGRCRNPCTVGRPCPLTFTCTPQNHFPQCKCQLGIANIIDKKCDVSNCVSSDECPEHLACYKGKCTDMCELLKLCGDGALCEMINHSPICSCEKSLIGDPYISCENFEKPQCENDLECSEDLGCFNGKCKDMCKHMNICGQNTNCRVNRAGLRKSVYCECISGYLGDPYSHCSPDFSLLSKCSNDANCNKNLKCSNGNCIDPCEMASVCVGNGALCRTLEHRPMCYCPSGFSGDPVIRCVRSECTIDKDCNVNSICLGDRCVDTCSVNNKCGNNAKCHSDNHSSQCICSPGFTGDAYKTCEHLQCIVDADCADSLVCSEHLCINPCKTDNPCGSSQVCDVINHRILCTCENGFILNNDNSCESQPGKQLSACSLDADCSEETACLGGRCKNMCDDNPCGINATCYMRHKIGEAMMICECEEGFVGNPFEECSIISRVPSGCLRNNECPWSEFCSNGRCVDPCSDIGVCGDGAMCQAHNHRAVCSCPLRHAGDPHIACLSG